MKLEKGAPVKVRLHTGEVVWAWYIGRILAKTHGVYYQGRRMIAGKKPLPDYIHGIEFCRFVGKSCVPVPVGVSV